MIKILHSTSVWLPITHSWMYNNIKYLDSINLQNHVVCLKAENLNSFTIPNIHVVSGFPAYYGSLVRLIFFRFLNIRLPFSYFREASAIKPDIWHSHTANWAWHNMRVADRFARHHVLSVYGADISSVMGLADSDRHKINIREVLAKIDYVLCEGPAMKRKLLALGCYDSKIIIHHLGVDVDYFNFKPLPFLSNHEPLKILMAGRFIEKKGFQIGIKALLGLAEKFPLQLTVIGDANTQDGFVQKQEIIALLDQLSSKCDVKYMGMQPYDVFRKSLYENHVFLVPSFTAASNDDEGGSPVAMTEAGAAGVILVGSRHCDIPELIQDGETGFLVEEKDITGIQKALTVIAEQRNNLYSMRERCRKKIEMYYNARMQCQKLSDFYLSIVDQDTDT
jgi:colanic acid/amylovoran biosynthesis glycosyltransferase